MRREVPVAQILSVHAGKTQVRSVEAAQAQGVKVTKKVWAERLMLYLFAVGALRAADAS